MPVCLLAMSAILLAYSQDHVALSVQDLVDAHLSGSMIHSLDVDIAMTGKSLNPFILKIPGYKEKKYDFSWVVTPTTERVRFVSDSPYDSNKGGPTNITDFLRKPEGVKVLQNYDWSSPQTLTPVHQGTVRAEISPMTADLPPGCPDPASAILRRFQFLGGSDRRTFRELVVKDGSNAEIVSASRPGLVALKVKQITTNGRASQNYYLIYFDPTKNFAITSLETHVINDTSLTKVPINVVKKSVVESFYDPIDDVSFPKKIVETIMEDGSVEASIETRYTIRLHSMNQPIVKSRVEFDFPEHAVVLKDNPAKNRYELLLWGPSGPLFEFHDRAELIDFWGKDDPLAQQSTTPGTIILIGMIVFTAVLVALWIYRRRKIAIHGTASKFAPP